MEQFIFSHNFSEKKIILIEAVLIVGNSGAPCDDVQMDNFDTFLTANNDVPKDKKIWTTYNADKPSYYNAVFAIPILASVSLIFGICYYWIYSNKTPLEDQN